MVSSYSFSFSRSRSVTDTLPEKEGPATFACKSKNASGRIGIFHFALLLRKSVLIFGRNI